MFSYSEVKRETERIKRDFPILEYFHSLVNSGNLKYDGIQGKEHFFGFLSQRTGSIAVDERVNVWYDHAAGKGGDIIEAVQVFEKKSFPQAVQRLAGLPLKRIFVPKEKSKIVSKIEIESVSEISRLALVNYIRERGLEVDEVMPFAKEVHWSNKGRRYFAVGFPNDAGGWVLRSSIFKGNILRGGISTEIIGKPASIKIFEGWFDFLSYMKLFGSTILKENEEVDLYLDNDATGEKTTREFIVHSKIFRFCRQTNLSTDWPLNGLKGSRDRVAKLISVLGIMPDIAEKIWRLKTDVSDKRDCYAEFEDINACLCSNDRLPGLKY
jgi:hypothetical protein